RVVLEGTHVREGDLESSIRMLRDYPATNLAEVFQPIFANEIVHNDRALKFAGVLGSHSVIERLEEGPLRVDNHPLPCHHKQAPNKHHLVVVCRPYKIAQHRHTAQQLMDSG
ncbi:MAG: hypothetical protein ACREX9_00975, partial [Gammaproteobacteria bacterium]